MSNGQQTENLKRFMKTESGRTVIIALTCLFFYGLLALCYFVFPNEGAAVLSIFSFIFVYWGWKALNMITPNVFLIMPIVGWLIYFGVKLVASLFVGLFIGPYKVGCFLGDKIYASQFTS